MILDISWILLSLIIFGAFVDLKVNKKYAPDSLTDSFAFSSTLILSMYALLYAITIILFNAFNIPIEFPKDDASLVVVLIYGAGYSLLSLMRRK